MKIGFVFDDSLDQPDGVQQYLLALGDWLRGQGHDVHYLVGATKRTDIPNVHALSRNVGVRFNGNRLTIPLPAAKRPIRELLAGEQFDVLHVQMPYSPMLAARVIRLAGPQTAIVGTFHILPLSRMVKLATRLLGWWLRPTLRRFDKIVAVSPAARDFAQQAFGLSSCDVLPNVADVQRFAQTNTQKAGNDDGDSSSKIPVITFLGRLVPRKGCGVLLEAAALVHQRNRQSNRQPFKLEIAGRGPLLGQLQQRAKELGIAERTEFLGFVEEAAKPGVLARADIAAFPSSGGESFGIVLIEAMAAGRPLVLAGDNPGYRSVMASRPELLFPATDATALADKLQHFLEDTAARRQAVAWQAEYVKQFDVDVVGRQLVGLYQVARQQPS